MKNIGFFSSENFHFLVVKFSVYLNRHVFVMAMLCSSIGTKLTSKRRGYRCPVSGSITTSLFILFFSNIGLDFISDKYNIFEQTWASPNINIVP